MSDILESTAQKVQRKAKQYFISGLLLVVPVVVTIIVLRSIFVFLDNLLFPYLEPFFGTWVPGIGIVIMALGILLIGVFATNFIGRYLVTSGEELLMKVPVVKSIYTSAKQIISTLSVKDKENQKQKKVVLVEYPRRGIWSVGLVNGEIIQPVSGEPLYSILIVAAINPTSGLFITVPKNEVVHLTISVEDAMKWIVSGGIITPAALKTGIKQNGETQDDAGTNS